MRSLEAAAVHQVHLVEIILVILARTALRGEIPDRCVLIEKATFVAGVHVADELFALLLVVTKAKNILFTVATRLPRPRLPVLLVVLARAAALPEVATASAGANTLEASKPETAGATAALEIG